MGPEQASVADANEAVPPHQLRILESIETRLLWLATYTIHHANTIRPNLDGSKVGGHQASCASLVSAMTALYFHALRSGDRVSVKPHASPVFHAIKALLGELPIEQLKDFRRYKGLQSYPSRTKDPDRVDFSTGSVGLGAVAPIFGALSQQFVRDHFGAGQNGHYISLLGDAELDEGNVWEALGEEVVPLLRNVIWIVDLNRQSLDRVVPAGKAQTLQQMFTTNGWHLIELKYGSKLQSVFERPGGGALRHRIDEMTNAEYHSLLLHDGATLRERLPVVAGLPRDESITELLRPFSDDELKEIVSDLGGHDLSQLIRALDEAYEVDDRPVVIVAYTVKGWRLPFAGDPLNHSLLMTQEQIDEFQRELGIPSGDEFSGFHTDSPEAQFIRDRQTRLLADEEQAKKARVSVSVPTIPESLGDVYQGDLSTQQAFGRVLNSLGRHPDTANYLVTASPDVAISTNLGAWINRMGVYSPKEMPDYFAEVGGIRPLKWRQSPKGHHIELGISENTLFLLLGMFGLSTELTGQTLLPVGTVYDPFVCRSLDALIYAAYSGAKFMFAGTPSGVSLSAEGGAHQSTITPSIGIELPNVVYYEPAFAQELEWIMLAGLQNLLDRERGKVVYLRLSTKPISQKLFPGEGMAEGEYALLRKQVIRGGYRLIDRWGEVGYEPGRNVVSFFSTGVMTVECVAASETLLERGIYANVIHVTGPSVLYTGYREAVRSRIKKPGSQSTSHVESLMSEDERGAPIVTVMDGHSHALSFLGGVFGTRVLPLGVDDFGQSGTRQELYSHFEIGPDDMVRAAECAVRG